MNSTLPLMLAVFVLVGSTYADPFRDYLMGKVGFWTWHGIKWAGFLPPRILLWAWIWMQTSWAVALALVLLCAAAWQIGRIHSGCPWPAFYWLRKLMGKG
ncbi:MAG: hypothetical protein KJ954_13885 [Alphaproteobacteria bacterium]|nr:hypothetical protein [Alphaproteobacteria bacterium]